ncbi:autotransporter outer membrane beta-barrel domain-containing protein [Pusillimonas sp. SM2304]|uniref:autotransporter outer membrane beta-barrel domain-containing protein n=1 Tax=Pusillimonas sp. SM2304 TaxID=3073241 RepID=UPI0028746331|nr:autotransporter outer membrane beta-barrel domain-containing protein [Pusillimonas sp. SM2304]MDS1140533.1 autotransporter outer membrane beta-barrel domain-containing protein [Pusillimonas sp. SM2304]
MTNNDICGHKVSRSFGFMAARVAGIAFAPVLLPASWTGAVDSAWAACAGQFDGSYLCSGASSGEVLTGSTGPLVIIADSTLNINSSGDGFDITGSGSSLVFSQDSGSAIIGATGINSKKYGAGSNRLTVAGDVTGTGDFAIMAYNDAAATDVIIEQTAGTITGVSHGIRVDNYGTGRTSIMTAGTVVQTAGDEAAAYWDTYGVYAYNASSATDITLTQTSGMVSGHYYGIYGNNQGTGSVTISSAGDVTTTGQGAGLAGFNSSNGKDVRISQAAGTITANGSGIYGSNSGSGSTHVTTAGTINATGSGVSVSNGSNTSGLSVMQSAGSITGGTYGILASNSGMGVTSVALNGAVRGGSGAGILTAAAGATAIDIASPATLSASSGLAIQHLGAGSVVVTSAGQVTGDAHLGPNDDTFNLVGGAYAGDIFGDDPGNAQSSDGLANNEGNDTFNWSGGTFGSGFYGLDGSDTATISALAYDGSQVLDGGDDTSVADGMVDTLNLRGVNAGTHGSHLVNWEVVNLDGGTLSINDGAWKVGMANEDNTGVFLSNGATLDGMAALALDGRLNIDTTSSFATRGGGTGIYSVSGDVSNAGLINMQDAAAGDAMTIAGHYVGTNGSLQIDTVLGDDNSRTDTLLVGGDTVGTTRLLVNNVNGTGAPTAEGIRVIGVGGQSDGVFSLIGDYAVNNKPAIVAGAYAYQLHQGGVSTPDDGDWYLRSQLSPQETGEPANPKRPAAPLYQAGVPSYEAYPQALLALNSVPTLQQRVGNRSWTGAGNSLGRGADLADKPDTSADTAGVAIEGNGVWGRLEGAHTHIKPHSTTSDTRYDQDIFRLQIGVDRVLDESKDGKLIGGLAVHYTHGKSNTKSAHGDGEISTDGYGVGGTLTWYSKSGFYLDGQARMTWYDSDLDSRLARRSLTQGNDGFGYATSIEGGKRIVLDSAWSVTPQAQVVYSNVDFDTFTDTFGARVSNGHGESLQGRLGVTLDHESSRFNARGTPIRTHVYGLANLHYEFLGATKVNVADKRFASRNDPLWASLGIGGSYNWDDDKYSIYGEGLVNTSLNRFADSYSIAGRVGFRMRW